MEPITTSVIIGSIVGYLGSQLKKNKSISGFISEFTEATVNWIKPLFLKDDGSLQKEMQKLKENPESEAKQNAVKAMLESEVEDNPEAINYLQEIHDKLNEKDDDYQKIHNEINVTGNYNKVYQNIKNSTIADSSVNQKHSGSGDNVAGNKITGE